MDLSRLKTTRNIANLKQGRNDWYRIVRNQADASPTYVAIHDEVGYFGVTAQDFIRDLSAIEGDIELHLSTPGGEVFDGLAIYGALKQRQGNVAVVVDSLAASIGSVIAMAASPGQLAMMPNASLMIHDGFALCVGNAADMTETAKLLDKTSDNIASIYAERTGKPITEWRAAMLAETWYIGQEAVDAGLADKILTKAAPPKPEAPEPDRESTASAHFDLSIFRNVPKAMRNQAEQVVPDPTPPDPPASPPTTPDPDPEAPADTDRGFVVPDATAEPAEADDDTPGDLEPEPDPEPQAPPVPAQIDWAEAAEAEPLRAWLREEIRAGVEAHIQARLDDANGADDTQNLAPAAPAFAWDPNTFLEAIGRGSK
jgi:ATP-dependent Clp endopeptidase proteolytic subunit ClpP